jgi:hypothetical protein
LGERNADGSVCYIKSSWKYSISQAGSRDLGIYLFRAEKDNGLYLLLAAVVSGDTPAPDLEDNNENLKYLLKSLQQG